ncbi:MAG: VWA domain-containing protein [Planctomycetes bacterium]|nr:VWA domain-containing protein [Planctomycetota bacterium]
MNRVASLFPFVFTSLLAAQAPPSVPLVAVPAAAARPIDLVICLDVSGSMDGLLNAARQNLWAVVNELATLQPAPQLRVALLTFGCPDYGADSGYVRLDTGFTTDLDLVSQKLFELKTNGGDEYVARAVQTALARLDWSPQTDALKLLFVAGNEAATQDPQVAVDAQCRDAIARGVIVNSIYCGNPNDELAPAWREVAKLADGRFAAIEQDANLVVVTPFDEQLTALSTAINTTYVPYGSAGATMAANQSIQDGNAVAMNSAAAAQRCQTKAGGLYWNAAWDLVDACREPKFDLAAVDKATLPEALRALSTEQLRAHVDAQRQKRTELQEKAKALGAQRDAFAQQELARRAAAGEKVFEQAVLEAVRDQAAARGFARRASATGGATGGANGGANGGAELR